MTGRTGMGGGRPLKAVGAAALEPAALAQEILAVLAATPAGVVRRSLPTALAERLAVPVAELPTRRLEVALGLLIAGGRADERAGRLVAVGQEHRRAV